MTDTVRRKTSRALALASALAFLGAGCGDHDHDHQHEGEVITTVILTFTPAGGGTPVVAMANDPDGDGGSPPVIDAVSLVPGMYSLAVKFENRLVMPAQDITAEVYDERGEHLVLFTGTAVNGPASDQASAPLVHAYADMDPAGLPVGLLNTITARVGMGTLTVTLRHIPRVNNRPVKTTTTLETARTRGLASIGGSNDVQVNFPVTVAAP